MPIDPIAIRREFAEEAELYAGLSACTPGDVLRLVVNAAVEADLRDDDVDLAIDDALWQIAHYGEE